MILELIEEQVAHYPLKPDWVKIRQCLAESISSAKHLCLVPVDGPGVLLAMAGANMWAQRNFAAAYLWVSKVPGAGAELLRGFRTWALERPIIRVAGLSPDIDVDERAWLLAERIGFKRHGGSYLMYTREYRNGAI